MLHLVFGQLTADADSDHRTQGSVIISAQGGGALCNGDPEREPGILGHSPGYKPKPYHLLAVGPLADGSSSETQFPHL